MKEQIAELLKKVRNEKGWTQQYVADKVGISRVYYTDMENGRYTPSLKVLARLSVLFDIDLNFLKENVGNTIQREATA